MISGKIAKASTISTAGRTMNRPEWRSIHSPKADGGVALSAVMRR